MGSGERYPSNGGRGCVLVLRLAGKAHAALDARAEYEVFLRFTELTRDRIAVIISHRFSTVRMADRILVLRNGELVERGTHE